MPTSKLPYKEGDWFSIPLNDGFAVGLIARCRKGTLFLGYFFGPRLKDPPKQDDVRSLRSDEAVFVARCSDVGLIEGEWRIITSCRDDWNRDDWPVPLLGRFGNGINCAKVEYSDSLKKVRTIPCSAKEIRGLPSEDGLGHGLVERMLLQLLSEGKSRRK